MGSLRRQLLVTAFFALAGAFLGIAGAGHAYLRRWRRSLLWFLLTIGAGAALMSVYITDPESIDPTTVTAATLPTEVTLPLIVIIGFSVADALLVAFLDQREAEMAPNVGPDGEADGLSCPHCGRSTDPELDFCTWCTESLHPPKNQDTD